MNRKLQEERAKAHELLNYAKDQQQRTFNLSDLKADKTQYFDSPHSNSRRSPFKASEFSARSTMARKNAREGKFTDADFDEIMRTSTSAAVRKNYRESIGANRLSFMPRTADMSLRSSVNSTQSSHRQLQVPDFWDGAKVSLNSFNGKNISVASDNFIPSDQIEEVLKQDEKAQEAEYAAIPRVEMTSSTATNWEEQQSTMRQPQMSFGQYCQDHLGNNIRDIYGSKSPRKRSMREPLIEMTKIETPSEPSNRLGFRDLQKMIQNCDTPEQQEALTNFGKNINWLQDSNLRMSEADPAISGISKMINLMDFSKVVETTLRDTEQLRAEKENECIPVHDVEISSRHLTPDDRLHRSRNAIIGRGLKRRTSSVSNETPKSTFDKCMRSKSPTMQKELQAVAATLLKPNLPSGAVFKIPKPTTVSKGDFNTFTSSSVASNLSPSSREYVTAMSINSPGEKMSLPSYGLIRPENVFSSPTSSLRSGKNNSHNYSNDGNLKRTVSQSSNGSEFPEDFLPIKIKKWHSKLSFGSVKLYKAVTKTISIQNTSNSKLSVRVKVQGAGFIVTPDEEFRMIPNEARTFEIRFMPTSNGPVQGKLIFERLANNKCFIAVPLFAYGGHASIKVEGVSKGPIGPPFVTMGHVGALQQKMEQRLTLINQGTLPGFAALVFEKTKWNDFSLSNSFSLSRSKVRLNPGESVEIKISFKATKEEIRKIITLNKEITIVGEIYLVTGDEPTRLRLLKYQEVVHQDLLDVIPKSLPNEETIKRELAGFFECLDETKIGMLTSQLKNSQVALTVARNMDDTQTIASELSMADDTNMSFETFYDSNRTVQNPEVTTYMSDDSECFESRYFRVSPALIIFSRQCDQPDVPKIIEIHSTCDQILHAEAVSSRSDLVSANKGCGAINPGAVIEIKVFPKMKAFESRVCQSAVVSILINDARVDVPVKFVE